MGTTVNMLIAPHGICLETRKTEPVWEYEKQTASEVGQFWVPIRIPIRKHFEALPQVCEVQGRLFRKVDDSFVTVPVKDHTLCFAQYFALDGKVQEVKNFPPFVKPSDLGRLDLIVVR